MQSIAIAQAPRDPETTAPVDSPAPDQGQAPIACSCMIDRPMDLSIIEIPGPQHPICTLKKIPDNKRPPEKQTLNIEDALARPRHGHFHPKVAHQKLQ